MGPQGNYQPKHFTIEKVQEMPKARRTKARACNYSMLQVASVCVLLNCMGWYLGYAFPPGLVLVVSNNKIVDSKLIRSYLTNNSMNTFICHRLL
jgi:hypothetical protein